MSWTVPSNSSAKILWPFGSDFDGGPTLARGMRDVRDLPIITEAMLSRGYSEVRIRKFLGDNLCGVFSQATA